MEREDGDEAARHRKLQAQSEGGRLGLGRPPVSMLGVGAGGWGLTQEDLQGSWGWLERVGPEGVSSCLKGS